MTRPDRAGPPAYLGRARVPVTRRGVDLAALAEELSTRLGRRVVLGGRLPQADGDVGEVEVRDADTGEVLDVAADVDDALQVHDPHPVRSPAAVLAQAARSARTVGQLGDAVADYADAIDAALGGR